MRKCRVCRCTEEDGCMGGCGWVEADLCSTCEETIAVLCAYMDVAHRFIPSRLMKEATARYREEALAVVALANEATS